MLLWPGPGWPRLRKLSWGGWWGWDRGDGLACPHHPIRQPAHPPQGGEGGGPASSPPPPPSPWENKLGGGWPVPRDGGRWQPRKRLQEVTAWFPLGSRGRHFRQDGRAGAGYGKVGWGRGGKGRGGRGACLLPLPPPPHAGMLLSPW